jgi:thioester reductase-like protein
VTEGERPIYLVTGFPRILPRRVALALLSQGDAEVRLLVQEKHLEEASVLRDSLPDEPRHRLSLLTGDVASMHLGLSTGEWRALTSEVTDLWHLAEWSFLGADARELHRVNVEGTRAVLELGGDCRRLRRLMHFSTVFVSGDRVGVVAEDELASGQSFRNAYEESKFEAEILVRRAMGQLPATVVRPSIVVGDSRTGEIDKFEGPYAIAMLLVTSPLAVPVPLPGNGVAPLNVVPVDYVVAAALHIGHDERAVGRTFHLVDPSPSSSRRVYEMIAQRAGKRLPRLSLGYRLTDALLKVPGIERLTREQRMAIAYVNHLSFFACRNTLEMLDGSGVRCPPIESYLDNLIEYVREVYRKRKEAEG